MSCYGSLVTPDYNGGDIALSDRFATFAYGLDELGVTHVAAKGQFDRLEIGVEAIRDDRGPVDNTLAEVQHQAIGNYGDALANLVARNKPASMATKMY